MCSIIPASIVILIYVILVYVFTIYLHFTTFEDYFECFACRELNLRNEVYDYIIVGSGAAGSIIAQRLSENPELKILLLEAGSSGNVLMQIPAAGLMLQNTIFDWGYKTVPQKKACFAMHDQVSHWPMGKILGGTGMLNNMIYMRGHPQDYARWFENTCNYNYTVDIAPYVQQLEKGGKTMSPSIVLSNPPFKSNTSAFFLQAGACLGYEITDELYPKAGFTFPKLTMKNAQRWLPIHQIKTHQNFNILPNALVEKILFKNKTHAAGVKYTHLDDTYRAFATKGVILSAGTIGTPKLLMLSGIGPKDHLEKLKIPVRLDLPVGDNLQDHITTGFDLVSMTDPPDLGIPSMISPLSAFNYFIRSKGPWTSPGCETLAFFNSEKMNVPEIQFMILPVGLVTDHGKILRHHIGITDSIWDKYFSKLPKTSFTILPIVLHPRSRGTVRLKNKNPNSDPFINPNYLTDGYDVSTLLRGIEMIKVLIETAPMKRLGVKLNDVKFPGCEKFNFDTRDYWECYIRHLTLTVFHPVGSCRIGKVVGDDFKVYGASNLYIVDGSVLPDLPSGNPMGSIMALAERASSLIQNYCWKNKHGCCFAGQVEKGCYC